MMDSETKREEADKHFEERREELKRADEEKTRKNKARREKQKARKDKAKVKCRDDDRSDEKMMPQINGSQAEGQNRAQNGIDGKVNGKGGAKDNGVSSSRNLPGSESAVQTTVEGGEIKTVEGVGIIIHDDG